MLSSMEASVLRPSPSQTTLTLTSGKTAWTITLRSRWITFPSAKATECGTALRTWMMAEWRPWLGSNSTAGPRSQQRTESTTAAITSPGCSFTTALVRYHTRFQTEDAEPLWFEKSFAFKVGPHLLRGRVDRVDRLPGGEYELIDYKTGRPKSEAQLAEDVQLSLYAVGAAEAWRLDASRQAYYYLLDDQKVALSRGESDREWILDVTNEVADGILSQGFEPTVLNGRPPAQ